MMKLKALFLSVLGLLCLNFSQGQTFEPAETLKLDNFENASFKWVDLNQDFLYDLLVYGKHKNEPNTEIAIFLNKGSGTFEEQTITFPQLIINEIQLKDFDRDEDLDIVFTGVVYGNVQMLSVLVGDQNFNFQLRTAPLLTGTVETFRVLDLNYDTYEDLVVGQRNIADSLEFKIWKGSPAGFEAVDIEFPVFSDGKFFLQDLDSDGLTDLILSGSSNRDTLTYSLKNIGDFNFESSAQSDDFHFNGFQEVTFGEVGGNGFPDQFIGGNNQNNQSSNILYENDGNNTIPSQTLLSDHRVNSSLLADFDSDGKTDLWVEAEKNDSTFLFWFNDVVNFSDTVGVYRDSLLTTSFADWDLNGHLDYAEIRLGEQGLELVVLQNQLEGDNYGPHKPIPQVAVQTGRGRMKVSWRRTTDSLTQTGSLSYDALLMTSDTTAVFAANMNTQTFLPTTPDHGNQLYADELVVNELVAGEYFFYVRSLDNAFNFLHSPHYGDCDNGGLCEEEEFELGKAVICDGEEIVESVSICEGSFKIFGTEGVIRNWYSDAFGPIGTTDLLTYTATGEDVLYGSVIEFSDCAEGQLVFNITTTPADPSFISIEPFTEICQPEELTYSLSADWTNITWTSDVLGDLGTDNTVTFTASESDRISVQAENAQGCTYQAFAVISLVDFEPSVADTVYNIEVGQSVQLSALGGDSYEWSPNETLSNPFIAAPVASPRVTTEYTVLIRNTLGCVEEFTIIVNVEQVGAVANLFSPNGDNRNDQFYLQLSSVPSKIDFRIYTRGGNLVYQETQGIRAISEGWDGTHKGEKLPPGVYYWKVSGTYPDGKPIVLNADNSGKVHLIR